MPSGSHAQRVMWATRVTWSGFLTLFSLTASAELQNLEEDNEA